MLLTSENLLLLGSFLIFISILFSKTGSRFGVPTLLLFLVVGMLFGSDGVGFHFNDVKQAQNIGMVALIIILFSGGMDTQYKEIRPIAAPGILLSTFGVLLTTLFTGVFIYYLTTWIGTPREVSWLLAFLLAATMASTDSASVFNILRSQRLNLKYHLKPLLELESGSNDPMAYMLTIVLIDSIATGNGLSFGILVKDLFMQFSLGIAFGVAFGFGIKWLLQRLSLRNAALYSILILSMAFMSYALTAMVNGNGYLTVYIAGLIVGNAALPYRKETTTFFDGMTWFAQIVMFLALGLLVNPHELITYAPVALLIGLFMTFFGRPLSVFLCLIPFKKIPLAAKFYASWIGLRGAVPIIFATYPVVAEVPGSEMIFNIVFFITLFSLVCQGMTVSFSANRLKLTLPFDDSKPYFGVEVPEKTGTELRECLVSENMLAEGGRIRDLSLSPGELVMFVKRAGDYHVPNGNFELLEGDVILLLRPQHLKSGINHNNSQAS